jgi:hypothetical protein
MNERERVLWEASERVLQMRYPDELSEQERLERYSEDAALCAAFVQSKLAGQD